MANFHLHRKQILTILSLLIVLLFVVLYLQNLNIKKLNNLNSKLKSSKPISFKDEYVINQKLYNLDSVWFLTNCFLDVDSRSLKFENIDSYLEKFKTSAKEECKLVLRIFNNMFELDVSYGEVKLDDKFVEKVKKWLDNNPEYLSQAYKQKIIKLYNKFYHDEMIYNPLRGKRPQSKQILSEKNYTLKLLEDSKNNCDFCNDNYKINTANEVFDRLESNLSYSAANTFKYDKWHSLIVSRNHDPLHLKENELIDLYDLSLKWFEKVNKIDKSAKYPELIWDSMPKSGASQVHTHLQVSMDEKNYYGQMRRWLDASVDYYSTYKRDFMDDFLLIHKALGLAYKFKSCSLIFNLIPLKDNEVMIICDNNSQSYLTISVLLHSIIRVFVDKLEQYSFSTGMYLPIFGETDNSYNPGKLTKIYCRILFRSPVANLRSDFNGLDLYTSSVVGVDRYLLANKIFKELKTNQKII